VRHMRLVLVIAGRGLLELSRMPGILAIIFVPGIVLYLIFTVIFVGGGDDDNAVAMPRIVAAVVDQDRSIASENLIDAMRRMSIRLITENEDGQRIDADDAGKLVESGEASVALVIPPAYGQHLAPNDPENPGVELIVNEAQPIEGRIVSGQLQMAAGMAMMKTFTDAMQALFGVADDRVGDTPRVSDSTSVGGDADEEGDVDFGQTLLKVHIRGVAAQPGQSTPPSSLLYLAGLIPMFLLFNCNGAASGMLEELSSGATRRMLVAPVTAADYLFGHMLMALVVALLQCLSMYLFAWLVFGAPIFAYPIGLTLLTLVTAFATVGFGMLMASIARTAEQLQAIGTVVILSMSALGGSMFPRFFMPDWIKPLGLATINGWAYDGFVDLFRGRDVVSFTPEMAVLAAAGVTFATVGAWLLRSRLRMSPSNR